MTLISPSLLVGWRNGPVGRHGEICGLVPADGGLGGREALRPPQAFEVRELGCGILRSGRADLTGAWGEPFVLGDADPGAYRADEVEQLVVIQFLWFLFLGCQGTSLLVVGGGPVPAATCPSEVLGEPPVRTAGTGGEGPPMARLPSYATWAGGLSSGALVGHWVMGRGGAGVWGRCRRTARSLIV